MDRRWWCRSQQPQMEFSTNSVGLHNFDVINGQQLNALSQAEILSLSECEKYLGILRFKNARGVGPF